MNRYRFTSKAFDGFVLFAYQNGKLESVEFRCELTDAQSNYLQANFPMFEENLSNLLGKSGKIEAVQQDLSFDNFWNTYGVKINRKRAAPLWERLTTAEKTAVFSAIPKYRYYCKSKAIHMANPENYLRDRRFEDEY